MAVITESKCLRNTKTGYIKKLTFYEHSSMIEASLWEKI